MKKYLVILNNAGSNIRFIIPADSEKDAIAYAVAAFSIFAAGGKTIPSEIDLTREGGKEAIEALKLSIGAVQEIE